MRAVLKHDPLERWIQNMIGGLKTVSLAWVNKIAVIDCTWLFAYESALAYEGRMNAAPNCLQLQGSPVCTNFIAPQALCKFRQ